MVVYATTRQDRSHGRGDLGDLADEVARQIDGVRADVAENAGPGLCGNEPPGAGISVPGPRLEVAQPEVDHLAELAGLEQLARKPDRRHEAVVESAQVPCAGPLGLLPQPVRLVGRQPE